MAGSLETKGIKTGSLTTERKEYWEFKAVLFQLKGSNILKEKRGLECTYKITQTSESAWKIKCGSLPLHYI